MGSKLSRYAEGVMEAVWLAALIVVPVFFNIYSSRIFEPDKISLLRTLALVALSAWIVKLLDDGGMRWDRIPADGSRFKALMRIPLLAPIAALALVYLLATILSVAPRISLWGSYQRLQGTYTTLSYLVIFSVLVGNLRTRAQVERLITTAILASLPVSLYGVLQRYEIDPVPWGGDVARRIASNLGNSIFVAAYLIMVNPLTLGRIVDSFGAILKETRGLGAHFVRATVYVFIAALQLIALYMSGSRGPMLGWLAGAFFLFVLLSLHWRKRWMTISVVGGALLVAIFLILLNVAGGPLEGLRNSPSLGRFGRLLDRDQRSSRVRILVWQGAADLVLPHPPLEFPNGEKDPWNALRPFIGYGPESMHVAYNPFFPPELADIERRNASPDRSHNETWDALVTTGILGLVIYLVLFAAIFYHGLKWLKLLTTRWQRNLFLLLYIGGGAIGGAGLAIWQGFEFFGVGLPFGAVIGLIGYLTVISLLAPKETPEGEGSRIRDLTLIMILSAIVAHFAEIQFGIAIAATRTYFWTFAGLLLAVGYVLPLHEEYPVSSHGEGQEQAHQSRRDPAASNRGSRRRRHGPTRRGPVLGLGGVRVSLVGAILSAILLMTLGYDFINVQSGAVSAPGTIWASLTTLPNKDGAVSYGVLTMVLTVWLAGGLLFSAENGANEEGLDWQDLAATLGFSALAASLFWLWHAGWLVDIAGTKVGTTSELMLQAGQFEGLLTRYAVYLLFLVFALALVIPAEWPVRLLGRTGVGALAAPVALGLALFVASNTNIRVIQADIAYKLADPFSRSRQYVAAIELYERASDFAPAEDFYYLFLGKAYLESAQTVENSEQQDDQVKRAERILEHAQELNPLNTDHTANLARLYRWWSTRTSDATTRQERARTASEYYDRALTLSPNNVGLWGELASLYLSVLNQPEIAYEKLERSLDLDPTYEVTYGLLGDYYVLASRRADNPQVRRDALENAAVQYDQAIENTNPGSRQSLYNFGVALGGVYVELAQVPEAITAYQAALEAAPGSSDIWRIQETIASLYVSLGNQNSALAYARAALQAAPQSERPRIQTLIAQLQGVP